MTIETVTCHTHECRLDPGESTDPASSLQDAIVTDELPKVDEPKQDVEQPRSSAEEGLVADPVFGDEAGAAIHYRTMDWWHAGLLMLAETISLGVLALPQCIAHLGLVPGLLLIFALGVLAWYTGFMIGQFKLAYPLVQTFADAGELIAGPIGREVMAISQVLILIFIQAAHILSFAIAMDVLTNNSTCSIVFSFVGTLICFVLGLPRTCKNLSALSLVSCISIMVAVLVAMVGIGVVKPDVGHAVAVQHHTSLVTGMGSVLNIILAYAGHVAFFTFAAELKDPRDFPKALAFTQISSCTFYLIVGSVVYYYAGPHVTSPALESASPIVRKVCFGLALPTIIIAGVVNGSVACKYVYFRSWKGTDVVHQKSFLSLGSWIGICAALWCIAWIISMAVPNFNILLGLIAALFSSWFSFGLPAFLWLYMNRGKYFATKSKITLTVINTCIFLLGIAMCVMGVWSSAVELARGAAGAVFSCKMK